MSPALPSDIVSLLSSLQAGIEFIRDDLRAVRDELRMRPTAPADQRTAYSTEEVATLLGKAEYTVREYCRQGRINATKREERRGGAALWSISVDEVSRLKDEGLLPPDPRRNAQ